MTHEQQMTRTRLLLIVVALSVDVSSIGADQVLGIPGIHFFFLGMGTGIFLTVGFWSLLRGCHHDA